MDAFPMMLYREEPSEVRSHGAAAHDRGRGAAKKSGLFSGTLVAALVGAVSGLYFGGSAISLLLGLPEKAHYLLFVFWIITAPLVVLRIPHKVHVGAYALVLLACLTIVRTLDADEYSELRTTAGPFYLVGVVMPIIALAGAVAYGIRRQAFALALVGALAVTGTVVSLNLTGTETGRAVLAQAEDANPVGLSVPLVSAAVVFLSLVFVDPRALSRRPVTKWLLRGGAALCCVVFFSLALRTGTRSVAIVGIVCVGLFLLARLGVLRSMVIAIATLTVVGIAGGTYEIVVAVVGEHYPELGARLARTFELLGGGVSTFVAWDPSVAERIWLWERYSECAMMRPIIGCGPRLAEMQDVGIYPHNIWLQVAGEHGVIGLALLTVAVVALFRAGQRAVARGSIFDMVAVALTLGGFVQLQMSLDLPAAKHFVVGAGMLLGVDRWWRERRQGRTSVHLRQPIGFDGVSSVEKQRRESMGRSGEVAWQSAR